MMDSFLVISSNISEQLFQRTSSDGYFLKVFCDTEAVTRSESVKKPLWQIWEISEENVRPLRNMFFLILVNKITLSLMVPETFVKWTTVLKNASRWLLLRLSGKVGCSSSTLTARDSVNKAIYLSTEATLVIY